MPFPSNVDSGVAGMRFVCPSCSAAIEITESEMGQPVGCAQCGNIATAPAERVGNSTLLSDFVIQRMLRRCADATDYLAHQRSQDRRVTVKILIDNLAADPDFVAGFFDRGRRAARLEHANLVRVFTVDREDSVVYLAREFVQGEPLEDRLKRDGHLSTDHAVQVVRETAAALHCAWEQERLLHGNLKPAVIEIEKTGRAKLADVGLTPVSAGRVCEAIRGTPQYMSPEMITGEPYDVRSDIYSLGALFFHILTGAFAFHGDTPEQILERHVNQPPASLKQRNAMIPDALEQIVLKMMAKAPADRFATPGEVARALTDLARGTATEIRSAQPDPPSVAAPVAAPVAAAPALSPEAEPGSAPKPRLKKRQKTEEGSLKSKKMRIGKSSSRTAVKLPTAAGATVTGTRPAIAGPAVQAAAPQGGKRFPAALAAIGVVLLAVVIGLVVAYKSVVPSSQSGLVAMYLGRVTAGESSAYRAIRPYLNRADFYANSEAELEAAAAMMHEFVTTYPQSLFTLSHEEINYPEMFGLPEFLAEKHAILGAGVAGTVKRELEAYDENLVQLRRSDRRKQEEARIDAYHKELAAQRREEERRRREEERQQRLLEAKQDRLNAYLDKKQEIMQKQFELTRAFKYSEVIAMLRPMAGENDDIYAEVAAWARRKIGSLELAEEGYRLLPNSGLALRGERITVPLDGKVRTVDIRTINNNVVEVKYKTLMEKEVRGRKTWENRSVIRELPLSKVPEREFEVMARLALEKKKSDGDYHALMGAFFYYAGDRTRAARLLREATDERAEILRREM